MTHRGPFQPLLFCDSVKVSVNAFLLAFSFSSFMFCRIPICQEIFLGK